MGSVLVVSAELAALQQGKEVHAHFIRSRFGSGVIMGSALVDMYANCEDALKVFEKMLERNVVS